MTMREFYFPHLARKKNEKGKEEKKEEEEEK
jgi:hypothetical protein